MRKAEQRLWDTMRRNKPVGVWAQRVENGVGEGMPDVLVAPDNWVELKAPTRPTRSSTPLLGEASLRESQIGWHLKAANNLMSSYILIRDDKKGLYLVPGHVAAIINMMTVGELNTNSLASTWNGIWKVLR